MQGRSWVLGAALHLPWRCPLPRPLFFLTVFISAPPSSQRVGSLLLAGTPLGFRPEEVTQLSGEDDFVF